MIEVLCLVVVVLLLGGAAWAGARDGRAARDAPGVQPPRNAWRALD